MRRHESPGGHLLKGNEMFGWMKQLFTKRSESMKTTTREPEPEPENRVVKVEHVPGSSDLILTTNVGRRYRGSPGWWSHYPSGVRCSTLKSLRLSEMLDGFLWQEEERIRIEQGN